METLNIDTIELIARDIDIMATLSSCCSEYRSLFSETLLKEKVKEGKRIFKEFKELHFCLSDDLLNYEHTYDSENIEGLRRLLKDLLDSYISKWYQLCEYSDVLSWYDKELFVYLLRINLPSHVNAALETRPQHSGIFPL